MNIDHTTSTATDNSNTAHAIANAVSDTATSTPNQVNGTTNANGTITASNVKGVNISLKMSVELAAVLRYRPMCEQYHADRHYRWSLVDS